MLWFAWKIVLLQYHKQRSSVVTFVVCRCDLLEKSYFCSITNSGLRLIGLFFLVVICLKNRTFAVSQTANTKNGRGYVLLWFAWKIVLLQYHKQQALAMLSTSSVVICLKNRTFAVSQTAHMSIPCSLACCDLLEKSYFCSITNSLGQKLLIIKTVVICLKNRTFAVSQTANMENKRGGARLWFAWKIVLLQYHKQLNTPRIRFDSVVICLKNRTFAVSQTAG